jgi:amidase
MFRGMARGLNAPVRQYMESLLKRDMLTDILEAFFRDWDALLCPVTVSPAIPHCPWGTPNPVGRHQVPYFVSGTAYTSLFNLTGHPVVVLPLARSAEGLPIGIQVVGPHWGEMRLLAIAERLALVTGAFQPPPGY